MIKIIPNWHPIFVHFAVGLLVIAAFLFAAVVLHPRDSNVRRQAHIVAHWNLWLGYGSALIAAFFGWLAFNSVTHDAPSHAAMSVHRNWALTTLAVFLPLVVWSVMRYRAGHKTNIVFAAALIVPTFLLGLTGWHGGELVYRYGLGVQSLPAADGSGNGGGKAARLLPSENKATDTTKHDHDDRDGHGH